ncbi:MAG: DUF3795 domain-containing protein [Oscillospiraceae bacterium]|nr:DUF3795 domain-containing protein [Oscillospiraceae bacterium]
MNLSSCGIDCDACAYKTSHSCLGCKALKGKPFWSGESGCGLFDCADRNTLPHCGKCGEFPCAMLQEWASDENDERIENLRTLINT